MSEQIILGQEVHQSSLLHLINCHHMISNDGVVSFAIYQTYLDDSSTLFMLFAAITPIGETLECICLDSVQCVQM